MTDGTKRATREMQRLDWSLSRKVTQDIKTQPQINHYRRSSLHSPLSLVSHSVPLSSLRPSLWSPVRHTRPSFLPHGRLRLGRMRRAKRPRVMNGERETSDMTRKPGETEGQTVIHSYFLYPTYRKRSG